MRILVVGGTRFIGRHFVAHAIGRGHEVTVLHRGVGCAGAPHAEHLHADRDGDLGVLAAGRRWEATIDVCAYWPRQVAHLADALGERGGRHALISTVSVYADPTTPGLDEQATLLAPLGLEGSTPPIEPHTYGGLKVGCEQVARQRHEGSLLVIRPTYVIGPHDHTGRFPYWVARLARGGTVLCPGSSDAPMQYIDARDVAAFLVGLLEGGDEGTFHTVCPAAPYSFADMLEVVRAEVAPPGTRLEWVPSGWLAAAGVSAGQMPLWTGSDEPEFALAMDPDAAIAAGLLTRPLAESARDTFDWLRGPSVGPPRRGVGMTAEREAQLLRAWGRRQRLLAR